MICPVDDLVGGLRATLGALRLVGGLAIRLGRGLRVTRLVDSLAIRVSVARLVGQTALLPGVLRILRSLWLRDGGGRLVTMRTLSGLIMVRRLGHMIRIGLLCGLIRVSLPCRLPCRLLCSRLFGLRLLRLFLVWQVRARPDDAPLGVQILNLDVRRHQAFHAPLDAHGQAVALGPDDDAAHRVAVAMEDDAAADGAETTCPMTARRGRASYLGARSAGHCDPGALSTALILAAAVRAAGAEMS